MAGSATSINAIAHNPLLIANRPLPIAHGPSPLTRNHSSGCLLHRYAMQRGGSRKRAVCCTNCIHLSASVDSGCSKKKILIPATILSRNIHPNHWMTFTAQWACSYLPFSAMEQNMFIRLRLYWYFCTRASRMTPDQFMPKAKSYV